MAHVTPVLYAIRVFGNGKKLAEAAGVDPSWVSRWKKGEGLIPSSLQRQILSVARERRLPLTAEDLIEGREAP